MKNHTLTSRNHHENTAFCMTPFKIQQQNAKTPARTGAIFPAHS